MNVREEIDKWCFLVWQALGDGKNVLELGCGGRPNTMLQFSNHNYYPTNNVINESWVLPEAILLDAEEWQGDQVVAGIPQFDCIIMNQVLEHCKHPDLVLYNIFNHLADGGILLITTPFHYRIHEYDKDGGETTEEGVLDYWRFTPHGMEVLLADAGFKEYYIDQIGDEALNPDVIIGLVFKKHEKAQGEIKTWETQPLPANWNEEMNCKLVDYKQKRSKS